MASRKEKERLQWTILILYGLYNTFDQWTRVLLPFSQWQLSPRPDLFRLLLLNSIGNIATLFGGFFVAQVIDSNGCRTTAIAVTVATAIYQILLSSVGNYYIFGVLQLLLMANHLPMVADTSTAQLVGEDGDDRERASLIMRLTVPQSIAFAVGPYLAIQILYLVSPSIAISQTVCGCAHLLTVVPIVYWMIPENDSQGCHHSYLPSVSAYFDMLNDPNMRWSLLFLLMVAAPYSAYDQLMRTNLASHMLFNPADMAKLALLLGITTIIGNILILPALQARLGPQALLQLSLLTLTLSYLYLSQLNEYVYLLIGMPIQVIGVCVAVGQISAQIMGHVGKGNMGKAAALNRGAQLVATAMAPLITGYYVDGNEASILCYVSAIISILGILLVHKYGTFMRSHFQNLPLRTHFE